MPTETNNYYAKATLPANGWRSGWLTKAGALDAAIGFVKQWKEQIGFDAECSVFYRDGTRAVTITSKYLLHDKLEDKPCAE